MRFMPKTEEEIAHDNLLEKGEYPFEISGGEDTQSKAGNDMIVLTVRVYKEDGSFNLVTDYLLEAIAHKLRHAAEACGLLDKYEKGELTGEDFVGKTGMLKLGVQEAKGDFFAKNKINDYIVPKDGEEKKELPKKPDLEDDGIPF
jgi:hypothetical protein